MFLHLGLTFSPFPTNFCAIPIVFKVKNKNSKLILLYILAKSNLSRTRGWLEHVTQSLVSCVNKTLSKIYLNGKNTI